MEAAEQRNDSTEEVGAVFMSPSASLLAAAIAFLDEVDIRSIGRAHPEVWAKLAELRAARSTYEAANATHDGRRIRRTVDGIVGNLNGGE